MASKVKKSLDYVVITPDGKTISVEEYMETEDYNSRLEKQIDSFMTNEKQKELIELFSQKETKKSRGCCSECGDSRF
jgi:hypothetical protein